MQQRSRLRQHEGVLLIDFGSQYTRLIAKAVRRAGGYCEVVPSSVRADWVRDQAPKAKGLILSGGPASVYERGAPRLDPGIYALGLPILGICYGMQRLVADQGGEVAPRAREYGPSRLRLLREDPLFAGWSHTEPVWMSHGDTVTELPPGYLTLACSDGIPHAAIRRKDAPVYGIQFHPEVSHTPRGRVLLENFLFEICGIRQRWRPAEELEGRIAALRRRLGGRRALIAVSGGVDSSVAAALAQRAIGDRLHAVLVDTGLLREGDIPRAQAAYERLGIRLHLVRAADRFFAALRGITEPEAKRAAIGEAFVRVFEGEAQRLRCRGDPIEVLIQGTIYSDVIESAGAPGTGADRIKTHHNVGGLPEVMALEVVEPLRDLFKDEVRALGRALGLPACLIEEPPFPGPGLAVRVLGEVTPERVALLRRADAIFREEVERAGLKAQVWQYFSVLLPLRSVGVRGDGRALGSCVALRAVCSTEGMTADWARLPPELLAQVSTRITNELAEVTRVVYDITSKPPATIEWE